MLELRALRPEDDRSSFRSGNPALDYFFQQFSGQNQFRHHIGTTYVAVEDGRILGYATVSPAHLESEQLAEAERKRLFNYPFPVLRLARLATQEDARGQGTGKALLRHVCLLAKQMSTDFGCVGLLIDAKVEAVGYYETFGFLRLEPVTGEASMQPVPMFLAINKLACLTSGNPTNTPKPCRWRQQVVDNSAGAGQPGWHACCENDTRDRDRGDTGATM